MEKTENLDDTQILCEALAQTIRIAFNQKLVDTKFSELGIKEKMNKESANYEKMVGMVELVEDLNIATALRILDEIPMAITDKIRAEGKNRKLEDLNLEFNE